MKIEADGVRLSTAFPVKASQPFWVELKDTEGFSSQEVVRFDVRAIKDEAPRVTIDEPSHDRDVPAEATVPLAITVDDDYGIQLVRLVYKIAAGGSEPAREAVIPLWAPPEPAVEGSGTIRRQEVRYRWDLSTLKDLQPGTVISFHAEGRDFDNLKGPNIGKSREMRLRIITQEDVERQLEDQQRAIRDEIDRILAIQQQAKAPVDDALRTLGKTDKLPEPLRDQVKNAEIIQRQVNNRITNKTDGLEQKLREAAQDARDFKAEKPDAQGQMADMREAVQRLKDRNLGPAEQALTKATKQLDPSPGDQDDAKEAAQQEPGRSPRTGPTPQPESDQAGAQGGKEAKPKAGGQPKAGAQPKDQAGGHRRKDQAGGQPKDQAGRRPKGRRRPGSRSPAEGQGRPAPRPRPRSPRRSRTRRRSPTSWRRCSPGSASSTT